MMTENAVDTRSKNFLTEAEVANFLKAARTGRHAVRNFAMMLLAYRHGLRVSELVNIRIEDIDLDTGRLFVGRLKGSLSTSQPLDGDEIRALRAWLRERINAPCPNSPLLFLSERGPMTRQAVNFLVADAGKRAGSVNHLASLIVNANYSVMRPAVELRKLNRVGDRVWPGKPQATKPQHVADEITTPAVHARADLINGYFFFFWPRSYESISGRDGEHTVHRIDSAFDSGRNN